MSRGWPLMPSMIRDPVEDEFFDAEFVEDLPDDLKALVELREDSWFEKFYPGLSLDTERDDDIEDEDIYFTRTRGLSTAYWPNLFDRCEHDRILLKEKVEWDVETIWLAGEEITIK